MGAELTQLTCEMFPFIEAILPKRGQWRGSGGGGGEEGAAAARIKGGRVALINVFKSLIPLFTRAERHLPTRGSAGPRRPCD